jgi:surface antigen
MVRSLRSLLLLSATLLAVLAATATPSLARTVHLSWQPTATKFWSADGRAITSLFHNGQCTQWAQERRPDVVRRATEALVTREIARHQTEDTGNWNARNWPVMAHLAHIPTGHVPRVSALIVFQPGVLGAGSSGHIAYVQRVYANGSFLISEMHAPVLWRVTHQRLTAANGRLRGVSFIY